MTPVTDSLLREVNRRINQLTRDFDGPSEFLCECGRSSCELTTLELHPTEFADLLATPDCLLVAPGHDAPGFEVVRGGGGYLIVRKAVAPVGPA
jgi:hypothetical protein